MPNTIQGGSWDYLPVLNVCLKLLLTVGIGAAAGRFGTFDAEVFVPQAVRFVFDIALPLLVARGLGVGIDFYDDSFLWTFIAAFLILRAIALILAVGLVFWKETADASLEEQSRCGLVAVHWLSMTWISTVILGIPIAEAVFDSPQKGQRYGILAAVSSFIFQLPLQLFLLECHSTLQKAQHRGVADEERAETSEADSISLPVSKATALVPDGSVEPEVTTHLWRNKLVWKNVNRRLLHNHVLWGIVVGFVLTVTTIGPKYLDSNSEDFVPGLSWVSDICTFIGNCVSPLSLFTMGVWMNQQRTKLFQFGWCLALFHMFSKLLVVPLTMVGLAKALDLNDEAGRAAVLIATLPISMASFSLAAHYNVGENVLAVNEALGTLLMLPTVLIWNFVMDKLGLFPSP